MEAIDGIKISKMEKGSFMDSELDKACETIEQLMEPCEKCGKIAKGARLVLPTDYEMPLCEECHNDSDSLIDWFAAELEAAVAESDEFEQLPDGKWRRIKAQPFDTALDRVNEQAI